MSYMHSNLCIAMNIKSGSDLYMFMAGPHNFLCCAHFLVHWMEGVWISSMEEVRFE